MNIRTPDIEPGKRQFLEDLAFVFRNRWFSRISLIHLRNNFHQLRPGAYRGTGNSGRILYLLSELLPEEQRISGREVLTLHFTGSHGEKVREMPDYQPTRWLVRAFDGHSCDRYHGVTLDLDTLWQVLEEAILDRARNRQRAPEDPLARPRRLKAQSWIMAPMTRYLGGSIILASRKRSETTI